MTPTIHSLERARQRLGCNAKSAAHMFANAISRGKTVADYKGLERHYLQEKSERGCELRVYNGYVYVIANETIVTVYAAPTWFRKTSKRHTHKNNKIEEDAA